MLAPSVMLIKNPFTSTLHDHPGQPIIIFGLKEAGYGVIEIELTDAEMAFGQDRIINGHIQKGTGKDPLEDIIGLRAEDRSK